MYIQKRLIVWAVLLCGLIACSKEEQSLPDDASDYPMLRAICLETKTIIDGTQLKFKVGDVISVFNGVVSETDHHGHNLYQCKSISEDGVASFEYMTDKNTYAPSSEVDVVATYPNRSAATSAFEPEGDDYGQGTLKIRMPAGPHAVGESGFAGATLPIIACAEQGEMLYFKHTCGILKLSLGGNATITKVEIESDAPIAGEATVRYAEENPILGITGTDKKITYTYEGRVLSASGTDFYFGIPHGTHSLKFIIHDADGGKMTRVASGLRMERAAITSTSLTYITDDKAITDLAKWSSYANCYVVARPGNYVFDAKKPNGDLVTGTSADWVWASGEAFKVSGSTINDMMTDIRLEDGKIYFTVPADMKYGSVVLGILNTDNILEYTWHIWMTSKPKDITTAGITIMDRNLGAAYEFNTAELNTSGELQSSRGCFYQWGRKDPILGGRNTGDESTAFKPADSQYNILNTSITNVLSWGIGGNFGLTQEDGSMNPVTLAASGKVPGYDSTDKSTAWSERLNANPCPYGYRVISSAEFTSLVNAADMLSEVNGNLGAVKLAGSVLFPRSGFRNAEGKQQYVTSSARYFCDEVDAANAQKGMYRKFDWGKTGLTTTTGSYGSYFGCSVRCVREEVVSIPSMPSDEISVDAKLSVASYNIWTKDGRTGSSGASGPDADELTWAKSYKAVAECINTNAPDVIGLNEVFKEAYSLYWSNNIQSLLTSYKWILYDENGKLVSTTSPIMNIYALSEAILYNPDKVTLSEHGFFWVADPSLDGVSVNGVDISTEQRHALWARFTHNSTSEEFYVFCLHNDTSKSYIDDSGNKVKDVRAQVYNSNAVLDKAREIVPAGVPSVIVGDFNSTAGDDAFELFRNSNRWEDAYETVSTREGTYMTSGTTITTMNNKDNSTLSYIRPDHIVVDGFNIISYNVDRNKYKNTDGNLIYPSDHFLIKSILSF